MYSSPSPLLFSLDRVEKLGHEEGKKQKKKKKIDCP